MNIKEALLKEHSKAQTMRIVNFIGDDPAHVETLMSLFLADEYRVTQRASWVISYCAKTYPALISAHLDKMVGKLTEPGVHDAVKRNIVKVLADMDIPDPLCGEVMDICYRYLRSADEPIAVKAHAMSVAGKISQRYPELKPELKTMIEDMLPFGSPGIISRGKKILRSLE
jgi:hypothetical protein